MILMAASTQYHRPSRGGCTRALEDEYPRGSRWSRLVPGEVGSWEPANAAETSHRWNIAGSHA